MWLCCLLSTRIFSEQPHIQKVLISPSLHSSSGYFFFFLCLVSWWCQLHSCSVTQECHCIVVQLQNSFILKSFLKSVFSMSKQIQILDLPCPFCSVSLLLQFSCHLCDFHQFILCIMARVNFRTTLKYISLNI